MSEAPETVKTSPTKKRYSKWVALVIVTLIMLFFGKVIEALTSSEEIAHLQHAQSVIVRSLLAFQPFKLVKVYVHELFDVPSSCTFIKYNPRADIDFICLYLWWIPKPVVALIRAFGLSFQDSFWGGLAVFIQTIMGALATIWICLRHNWTMGYFSWGLILPIGAVAAGSVIALPMILVLYAGILIFSYFLSFAGLFCALGGWGFGLYFFFWKIVETKAHETTSSAVTKMFDRITETRRHE
jgi:hypothetical protein